MRQLADKPADLIQLKRRNLACELVLLNSLKCPNDRLNRLGRHHKHRTPLGRKHQLRKLCGNRVRHHKIRLTADTVLLCCLKQQLRLSRNPGSKLFGLRRRCRCRRIKEHITAVDQNRKLRRSLTAVGLRRPQIQMQLGTDPLQKLTDTIMMFRKDLLHPLLGFLLLRLPLLGKL